MRRWPKLALKRIVWRIFSLAERMGVHVLPRTYYSPVADRGKLRRTTAWRSRPAMPGIAWDVTEQARWFSETCEGFAADAARAVPSLSSAPGQGYGYVEGLFLYCFIRSHRPARVLEIGSGTTTAIMLAAADDAGYDLAVQCVDPFSALTPRAGLEVIRRPAEDVDVVSLGSGLQAGDLLFIDSTHTVCTGSEVARLYVDVIPSLAPHVFVQVHDINLPYLYKATVLQWFWDWQETTLLAALLSGNDRLRVLCSQAALHHDRPDVITRHFPGYEPAPFEEGLRLGEGHFPTSFWAQTA